MCIGGSAVARGARSSGLGAVFNFSNRRFTGLLAFGAGACNLDAGIGTGILRQDLSLPSCLLRC